MFKGFRCFVVIGMQGENLEENGSRGELLLVNGGTRKTSAATM